MDIKDWFICPVCKGKGKVWDHFACIGTIGLGYLLGEKDRCPRCGGKGYILIND